MKKKILLSLTLCLFVAGSLLAQKVEYSLNKRTGAIQEIKIQNDDTNMSWLISTDRKQYQWIGEDYGWGLGDLTLVLNGVEVKRVWLEPEIKKVDKEQSLHIYNLREVEIHVTRKMVNNDLVEYFEFKNKTNSTVKLKDIAVSTPFNDNYPDAETCYRSRTNAHVWAGNSNAYVNAMRMGAFAPHLGLVLTEGSIKSYEIRERAYTKGWSNLRGAILLNPENCTLNPNESYKFSWTIFAHDGQSDFYNKLLAYGSVVGRSDKYVYEKGEKARVEFEYGGQLKSPAIYANGKEIKSTLEGNKIVAEYFAEKEGDLTFTLNYGNGKSTYVQCLTISGEKELISKRVNFIIDKQQFSSKTDSRDGAYLVYDNEAEEIFLNPESRHDCDEGRERLGMGVLLALQYQRTKDEKIKESLLKYYNFVRRLQQEDYTTFSTADHKSRNRAYNYPWVATFYFEMFNVTGDKKYLSDAYLTLKALYRKFGHGFYAIDTPVKGYYLLKSSGFAEEAESLLDDFKRTADAYLKNGWHYPKSEVNYEQSIVGPSIIHLLRTYLVTKDEKYLSGAKELLPLLESFGGSQPSYFMNEIAIRHWDGYWFGKYRLWGDTFVHYWSTITAVAYNLYYRSTGDESYQERAKNIVRNNLCQFFEDGSASCAFIYPNKVNGENAHVFDPYANDQDWALVFNFYVNNNL